MSKQNVAIVARGWEHFRATGSPLESILAPDFVWDMSTFDGWPERQSYEGIDGVREFLRDWSAEFEDWTIDVESMHDAGEKVVCVCRQRGRAKRSGLPVDMRLAMVFTLRDGLETRMEMYADPAAALAAERLDE
jgi:ketosteroid isomerase-like protein